jgi:peptidoglycan hydrolase-like protein with peptidoglycan-binding domain
VDAVVYNSLLEVPLDQPGVDGNDQDVPGSEFAEYVSPVIGQAFMLTTPQLVVPYLPSGPGSKGLRVRALNRALSKAGFRKWQIFSTVWNPWVTKALKNFQKSRGLPITGKYDKATHAKLARFYDAYSIRYMLNSAQMVSPEERKRNGFMAELMYIYNRRWNVHYTQNRPWDTDKPPYGLDCSSSGEWASMQSGLPNLSGYTSWGYGNTDTQIYRLRRLGRARSLAQAEPGDPVYYGWNGDPSHVAYWIGGGRVWSFGSYPAKILAWNYRTDFIGCFDLLG